VEKFNKKFLLEEDIYWDIIARPLANSSDQESQLNSLVSILSEYSDHDLYRFELRVKSFLLGHTLMNFGVQRPYSIKDGPLMTVYSISRPG